MEKVEEEGRTQEEEIEEEEKEVKELIKSRGINRGQLFNTSNVMFVGVLLSSNVLISC